MKRFILSSCLIGIAATVLATDGPLTAFMNLRGRTDENGYLMTTVGTAGVTPGPLTAMANLRARTDENGYLITNCSNCSGSGSGNAPTDATYITQTANSTLSAEQALSSLSSGIMRVATTTGVITSLTDSAGIAANISDETGTGVMVFATSPTLVTPVLGVASATRVTARFVANGSAPAVSNTSANSCGTTAATIVGNDNAFKVTVGATAGTSCTVTFQTAFANAPSCVATNETTANLVQATSTTTTVIIAGTMVAGDVLSGLCLGR